MPSCPKFLIGHPALKVQIPAYQLIGKFHSEMHAVEMIQAEFVTPTNKRGSRRRNYEDFPYKSAFPPSLPSGRNEKIIRSVAIGWIDFVMISFSLIDIVSSLLFLHSS